MSKIALATAIVALTAAVPFAMGRAEAQSLAFNPPPGAAYSPRRCSSMACRRPSRGSMRSAFRCYFAFF